MGRRGFVTATVIGLMLLFAVLVTQDTVETASARTERSRSVVVVTGEGSVEEVVAGPLGDAVVTLPASGVAGAALELDLLRLEFERLVILGGLDVVSAQAAADLAAYTGVRVTRIAGADRYATAAQAATSTFAEPVRQVLVATVEVSPQAVSAANAAVDGSPVLLVTQDSVPAATAAALRQLRPRTVAVLGDSRTVGDAVVRQLQELTASTVVRLAQSS